MDSGLVLLVDSGLVLSVDAGFMPSVDSELVLSMDFGLVLRIGFELLLRICFETALSMTFKLALSVDFKLVLWGDSGIGLSIDSGIGFSMDSGIGLSMDSDLALRARFGLGLVLANTGAVFRWMDASVEWMIHPKMAIHSMSNSKSRNIPSACDESSAMQKMVTDLLASEIEQILPLFVSFWKNLEENLCIPLLGQQTATASQAVCDEPHWSISTAACCHC